MTTSELEVGDYGIIISDEDPNFAGTIFKVDYNQPCTEHEDLFHVKMLRSQDRGKDTDISTDKYKTKIVLICPALEIMFDLKDKDFY